MAQDISFDTPIDGEFKFTEEVVHFLVDNIRLNTLSLTQPVACSQYYFKSNLMIVTPVFFALYCDNMVHFELIRGADGLNWALHFEQSQKTTLKPQNKHNFRSIVTKHLVGHALLGGFHSIFPVDAPSEKYEWKDHFDKKDALVFKSSTPIDSISAALEAFDEFYSMVIEAMDKADINQFKDQYPDAVDAFRLVQLMTKVKRL